MSEKLIPSQFLDISSRENGMLALSQRRVSIEFDLDFMFTFIHSSGDYLLSIFTTLFLFMLTLEKTARDIFLAQNKRRLLRKPEKERKCYLRW